MSVGVLWEGLIPYLEMPSVILANLPDLKHALQGPYCYLSAIIFSFYKRVGIGVRTLNFQVLLCYFGTLLCAFCCPS